MVEKLTTKDLTDFLTTYGRKMKFCFILGSGCSIESGIPTGWELASKWYQELPSVYSSAEIARWKIQENVGGVDFGADYAKIFRFRFGASLWQAIEPSIRRSRRGSWESAM